MTEETLTDAWATLGPDADSRYRINTRVFSWMEARDTSLASEWLQLLRIRPFSVLTLVTACAVVMIIATPAGWIARALAGVLL